MAKSSVALLTVLFLGVATSSIFSISPYDLIEEVYVEYDDLRMMVEGDIAVAQLELSNMNTDLSIFAQGVYNAKVIYISTIHQDNVVIANQLKDAAASQGFDITPCAEPSELKMNALANEAGLEMQQCINYYVDISYNNVGGAQSRVNGLVSRVHAFRFEIFSCNGALICLAPLIQRMQLEKIEIPQEIDVQVLETRGREVALEVQINSCSDNVLSKLTLLISAEIQKIAACLP